MTGIGLLKPERNSKNNYRIYNTDHLDKLQQILFYRELGMELGEIRRILDSPDFDREKALTSHLAELKKRRERLELLIENVQKTIASMKGEIIMRDTEKLTGFKKELIEENERKYGKEVRRRYGDDLVNASNTKLMGMTKEQYAYLEKLTGELNNTLRDACLEGDPAGEKAQEACRLHKKWLSFSWPEGVYSPEAHIELARIYVEDERFNGYYEKIAPGCAVFLYDALNIFYSKA